MRRTVKSKKKLLKWFKKHGWEDVAVGWKNPSNDQGFANKMFELCGEKIKIETYTYSDMLYDYQEGDCGWDWLKGWFVKKEK
jgi:hypothetical protein